MTSPPPAIELARVRKRFRRTTAVDDVSLRLRAGEILGLLGRNGAGKSTTVEMIAGLRRPDSGTVRVMGLDPTGDRSRVRAILGVQLQQSVMHDALTVIELARLHAAFHEGPADPEELIGELGLSGQRETPFAKLSGGQQQRLSIVIALIGRPRVVLLDELTTGLDPEARRSIWSLVERLRDSGTAILLVSHQMEEVERLCDEVVLLDRGRVRAAGTPGALIEQAGLDGAPHATLDDAFLALTDSTTKETRSS